MVQEVDILKAVRWISEAWSVVSEDTIEKCFQTCGFIREICEEAESAEIDKEFEELVRRIDIDVAPADYIAADDTVQFCHEPINTGKKIGVLYFGRKSSMPKLTKLHSHTKRFVKTVTAKMIV